jgi:hypothetical protein
VRWDYWCLLGITAAVLLRLCCCYSYSLWGLRGAYSCLLLLIGAYRLAYYAAPTALHNTPYSTPTALLQHSTAHHRTVNTPILHQLHPTVRLSTPPYITVHNIYNYNDYATDSTVRYSNNKVHSSQKQYGVQYIVNPTTIHRQTHRLQPTNIPGGPRHHHCTSCHHHHHQPVSISKKLSQEKVLAPPQPPDLNTHNSPPLSPFATQLPILPNSYPPPFSIITFLLPYPR